MPATRSAALIVVAALVAAPGQAHHSSAIYESERTVTLTGEVREFQWTNPHCWIQVIVPGPDGDEEWSVEMAAPLQVYQAGWKPSTLKPGDAVSVVVLPARDGTYAGLFVSATGEDGKALGRQP
jgi:Family of unknown function (DUF6152)